MTIIDTVRRVLGRVNSRFTLNDIHNLIPEFTNDQISKSLRSMTHVKSLGKGKYCVRGRRVSNE